VLYGRWGANDVTIVCGWYSDNSVLLEDPGVYLRPGVCRKFYGTTMFYKTAYCFAQ